MSSADHYTYSFRYLGVTITFPSPKASFIGIISLGAKNEFLALHFFFFVRGMVHKFCARSLDRHKTMDIPLHHNFVGRW